MTLSKKAWRVLKKDRPQGQWEAVEIGEGPFLVQGFVIAAGAVRIAISSEKCLEERSVAVWGWRQSGVGTPYAIYLQHSVATFL
jgi:hypothetical protein